jgi:predicted nicotinamide N-methyase
MAAPEASVLDVLRARLDQALRTVHDGATPPGPLLDLAVRTVSLPGGDVILVRPRDWTALLDVERDAGHDAPFWAATWPAGEQLAGFVAMSSVRGLRVLDVGCGLGLASIAAARAGADVLAIDASADGATFAAENLSINGVDGDVAACSWTDPALAETGPFDVVLGGDVLYSRAGARSLLEILPALVADDGEAWITDPGRAAAEAALTAARGQWSVASRTLRDDVVLHRLRHDGQT